MNSAFTAPSRLAVAFTGTQAPRVWRGLFTLLVVAVLALALMPTVPHMPSLGWDKLNHVFAFVALAFAARFAFPTLPRVNLRLGTALLTLGLLIELAQALTPTRMADAVDLLADGIGIAIGLGLAALLLHWTRRTSTATKGV